jgi:hypothetical protein
MLVGLKLTNCHTIVLKKADNDNAKDALRRTELAVSQQCRIYDWP